LACFIAAIQEFYPVFYSDYDWGQLISWLSPAAAYTVGTFEGLLTVSLYFIIYTILALTGAVLLYRQRGSEAAGKAIAFKTARPLLKYSLAFLAASVFSLFLYGVGRFTISGYFWFYFGAIVGGFLATQITEIVYAADFRALFRNMRGLAVFLFIYLGLTTWAVYDLGNFNWAVPRADQVTSAQILLPSIHNHYDSYWYSFTSDPFYAAEQRALEKIREQDILFPVTSPEALAAVVNIAARYADTYVPSERQEPLVSDTQLNQWKQTGREYLLDYWDTDNGGYYYGSMMLNNTSLKVVYTLSSGRRMARDYGRILIPVQFLLEDLAVIYREDGFRAALFWDLMHPVEHYMPESLKIFELHYGSPPLKGMTGEDRNRFIYALRADMLELTLKQQQETMPIGVVGIRLYGGPVANPQQELLEPQYSSRPHYYSTWPIYATFSRTLAFFEEYGIDRELFQPQLEAIKSVDLTHFVPRSGDNLDNSHLAIIPERDYNSYGAYGIALEYGLDEEIVQVVITDPGKIAELMSKSYLEQATRYNQFIDIDRGMMMEVQYEVPGGPIYTQWRVFPYVLPKL
jgi:ABC-2 type transport system permease protein